MKVIFYSIGCPRCLMLESKLKSKSIDYTLVDSEETMINMGFSEAPMLEVDGVLMGFDSAKEWVVKYNGESCGN